MRAAGTSFYHGMRVLPPDRRQAMYAIYAFCRIVDDIADEHGACLTSCRDWQAGAARRRPVPRRVRRPGDPRPGRGRAAFRLRQEDFLAVIDGMQMDAESADRGARPGDA